jgi:ribosomal protein S18 acetylase RimI-like enzyme
VGVELREVAEPHERAADLAERLTAHRMLGWYADPLVARAAAESLVESLMTRSTVADLVGEDAVVGWVWLLADADAVEVLDSRLDRPESAPELLDAIVARAAATGLPLVRAAVVPGDAGREALVAAGEFATTSTTMLLGVFDRDLPEPTGVRLDPMTAEEFAVFDASLRTSYVEARIAAGDSPERAARVAEEQLGRLLPTGRASEHQHFFTARASDRPVGHLWLHTGRPMVFVDDVEVRPDLRGQGYGRAIMQLAALWAQQRAAHAIGLNVFSHNTMARDLYERLGYRVTERHGQLAVTPR